MGIYKTSFSDKNSSGDRVHVKIGGISYFLSSNNQKSSVYVQEIATQADRVVQKIREENPNLPMQHIHVLALIQTIDVMTTLKEQNQSLYVEMQTLKEKIEIQMLKNKELKTTNKQWKDEVLKLQHKLNQWEHPDEYGLEEQDGLEKLPMELFLEDLASGRIELNTNT